jgi:hypothetical protein
MTASTNRRIKAALAFAARGWPVFPLTPGAKKPLRHCPQCDRKSPEYVPHRGIDACPHPADTCHGFHAASADPERIEDWGRRFPEMNLGIATGPARLVVVDLDRNKAGTPPPAEYEGMGVIDDEMRAEIYSAGRAAERDEDEIEDAIETAFDYVARRGAA